MKRIRCFTSTAAALNEVFLVSIGLARPFRSCSPRIPHPRDRCTRRQLSSFVDGRSVPTQQYGPASRKLWPPHDEHIQAYEVQVVDEDNSLKPPTPLSQVLNSLNRKTHTLIEVASAQPGKPPVCKIYEKKARREAERAKAKAPKTAATLMKQLELNWAIDPNDLGHRLNKIQELLEQGRRVEIILAGKRKGRKATEDEAQTVLKRLRGRVEELEGAREWKEMEGKVLEQATLFFEGKVKK
ncbi:MAG: hypothetical protein M1830_009597 [Pleopsidium flavum]|nr:MAG: hypothetical protein M1830_009597 [Pleopsidium flavum]